jgi:peptidoglycan/LPS O-acetylase OafA/YrhL
MPGSLISWLGILRLAGFDSLGLGVLTAYLAHRCDPSLSLWLMAAGLFAIVVGATAIDGRSLLIAYGAAAFVLGAQARDALFCSLKLPSRLGQLSYEMYLLHPLVIAVLLPAFRVASMRFDVALLLSIFSAAFVAAIVETTFTRPTNIWLRKALSSYVPVRGYTVR